MSKARILANLISDNAELADGQISVAEVVGAAPTANPTFTGTVNADAITMSGFLTVNGGADFNTVLYPDGIAMADSRTISFGTSADFELNGGSTFLDFNLKDNARHLRIKNNLVEHHRFSGDGSVIFNISGADADFRVESDNNTHMIFVDGGNNSLAIGNTVVNPASGFSTQAGFGYSSTGQVQIAATSSLATLVLGQNQGTNGSIIDFRKQGNIVGTVSVTGAGTTYNTTSDRRLKDNIQPIADATDKLMSMKPVTHTWIANPEAPSVHGFIAQEMQEIVPEAVSGEDGGEEMMSMDYGRITPVLVAALQEATNEIKALKQRVSELENK